MVDLTKQTPKQRANYHYMTDAMRRLEWDLHHHIEATSRIPDEWHEIAKTRAPQGKQRITMAVDRDVLRFFRSMGAGYQPRLNEVLRSYMHARLAGVIRGAETMAHHRRAEAYHEGERPGWGDTMRQMGEDHAMDPQDQEAEGMERVRERAKLQGLE